MVTRSKVLKTLKPNCRAQPLSLQAVAVYPASFLGHDDLMPKSERSKTLDPKALNTKHPKTQTLNAKSHLSARSGPSTTACYWAPRDCVNLTKGIIGVCNIHKDFLWLHKAALNEWRWFQFEPAKRPRRR